MSVIIKCMGDLCKPQYGLDLLTGEACGLGLRLLCDFTEKGRKLLIKTFGFDATFTGGEAWNSGSKADPHVGSIMLSDDMWRTLAIFALLENGCVAVYTVASSNETPSIMSGIGGVYGFTQEDLDHGDADRFVRLWKEHHYSFRKFGYHGTAGDRNRHAMSGRIT